uniref:Protein wech n=1 Tax=Bactrocera latifrons TaxID=174628 RepID=A0A0K8WKU0_BACLA
MNRKEVSDSTMAPNIAYTSGYKQKCREHNEVLQYVCENCRMLLCNFCFRKSHTAHNCFQIDNFLTHRNDLLFRLIESGRLATNCYEDIGYKEVDSARHIDNNCNLLAQSIRNTFRPLIASLQQRESNLLDVVNKMHKNRMENMYEQISALKASYLGLMKVTKKLNKVAKNGHQLENLYIVTQILEAQRQVDIYAKILEEKQYKDEFYKFYAPQVPNEILRNIENLGSIQLDDNNDFTASSNIPRTLEDATESYIILSSSQETSSSEVEIKVEKDTCNKTKTQKSENDRNSGIGQAVPGCLNKVKALRSDLPSLAFAPKGNGQGHVQRPWGVCVNQLGDIFITDRLNHNVQIFSPNGEFIFRFGRKGKSRGQFNAPAGICVDKNGRIIVADKNNHRIQVFSSGAKYLLSFGRLGTKCGKLKFPFDVAVNTKLQIAVTDSANHRIQQFDYNGHFIREIPLGICTFTGYEITPRGICYTPKGNIIVTDYVNHCLHLISPVKEKIVSTKGCLGFGYLQFSRPSGVCCDDDGTIIVADCHNHRICVFSSALESLWNIDIRPSVNGLNNTYCDETDRTCDVALTKDGHIVFISEMLPAHEAAQTSKRFVHVY